MTNQNFIRTQLIKESQALYSTGFYFPTLMFVANGIETLGAFIDSKPLGAKAQSKKRFNKALLELFPTSYHPLVEKDWLYKQMRCNLSHMCSTGAFITLVASPKHKTQHLKLLNNTRIICIAALLNDFIAACHQVIQGLESGGFKQKAMALTENASLISE
jgi:hypothetical protein